MSPQSVVQLLDAIGAMSQPSFEDVVNLGAIKSEALTDFKEDPDDSANMKASLVACAFSGPDACLDFYDASPFVMAQAKQHPQGKLTLRGVVRIDTRTSLMISIFKHLRTLRDRFPPQVLMMGESNGPA